MKILFTLATKQAILMRGSTALSLPLQFVFPGMGNLMLSQCLENLLPPVLILNQSSPVGCQPVIINFVGIIYAD